MRLRRLQILVQTADGPYGTVIDFPDGLVVVWADNSMGKSTCVKAILVALGLEAMLTTSQTDLPLTPAVTTELEGEAGLIRVESAEIRLEIENTRGERVTIQRAVGGSRDNRLVTVVAGPVLTDPGGTHPARDFFIGRPGAATRELGFHHYLAVFLGWELPAVQTFDGGECPLYLQCLFPYFVVEQTRGWSTLQPPIPTHFRVREPSKRGVEFLLDLDARRNAIRRQELQQERAGLEAEWAGLNRSAQELGRRVSGVVQALPSRPSAKWPPQVPPVLAIPDGDGWITLANRLAADELELARLVQQEIPRVQEIASAASQELAAAEGAIRGREALLARLLDSCEMERAEVAAVHQRLEAIAEDIQRNKDVQTLRRLGSTRLAAVSDGACPICHQPIQDTLVPLPDHHPVMSIEENIDFLTEQRRTYSLVLANAERVVTGRERQIQALRAEIEDLRGRIRSLRQTLLSDGRLPSAAAIRSRLQLEDGIRRKKEAAELFGKVLDEYRDLSSRWSANQLALQGLPSGDTSAEDADKIGRWSRLLREQLAQYGFRSLPTEAVAISTDTYRPEYEGFDLQTSISASDLIRTIWSYLHGMLELAREVPTHHPGFVVFDEPRQQSTRDVSFGQLLRRASEARRYGQQVVFFTSEERGRLEQQLRDLPHSLVWFPQRIICKL